MWNGEGNGKVKRREKNFNDWSERGREEERLCISGVGKERVKECLIGVEE